MDISRYLTETMARLNETRGEGLDRNVDALHITGELVGGFLKDRQALKAIALSANPAVLTAWSNDNGFDTVFARQVEALGEAGGVLLEMPSKATPRIQEAHVCIYHFMCQRVEGICARQ